MAMGIPAHLDGLGKAATPQPAAVPGNAHVPHPVDAGAVSKPHEAGGQPPLKQVQAEKVSKEDAAKINKELQSFNPKVNVSVDFKGNRYIVSYKDPKSGRVIQQLPPEGVLKMIKQFKDGKGFLINSKG